MSKLGSHRSAWKVQRNLMVELPGMGKPGALERRPYPSGQHGMARRKFSEYSLRLREKQKMVFNYGLREQQLRLFVQRAKKGKSSDWMSTLIGMLESRLDCVVFRLGFAQSIPAARQLVLHGKIKVDGKRVTIGSFVVPVGSEVSLSGKGAANVAVQYSLGQPRLALPEWLSLTPGDAPTGKLKYTPPGDAIPFPFEARLVAEYYAQV
ncbi:MAG: 30S ribosomal protein S4 [Proteobacteria bacterium]|nr:MAG: 30S ribosomal protein S4 [Pseudomonadota bacterium]